MNSDDGVDRSPQHFALSDLALFFFSFGLVPAVWLTALGWNARLLLSGADGFGLILTLAQQLAESGSDWGSVLYRSSLLGGARLADTGHLYLPLQILVRFGLSPVDSANALILGIQGIFGFFTARLVADWLRLLDPTRPSSVERLGITTGSVLLGGFSPVLAWRLGYGQLDLALAAAAVLGAFALWVAWLRSSLSLPLIWIAVATIASGLLSAGTQVSVYAVFFGVPLALAVGWDLRNGRSGARRGTDAILILVFLLCAALMVGDRFANLWAFAFSLENPGALGANRLQESTQGWRDWLVSMPWSLAWFPQWRSNLEWHEHYFSFGPPLAALLLVPWRRLPLTGVFCVLISFVLVFFGLGGSAAGEMGRWFSPLVAFPAPGRAALAVAPFLLTLGIAALAAGTSLRPVAILAGAILAWILPAGAREIVLWIGFGLVLFSVRHPRVHGWFLTGFFVLVSASSVSAYRERQTQFPQRAEFERRDLSRQVAREFPGADTPWVRGVADYHPRSFDTDRSLWEGLSSIEGYGLPTARFRSLVEALQGERLSVGEQGFDFRSDRPGFAVLRDLYHVRYRQISDGTHLRLEDLNPRLPPAWFAADLQYVPDFASLATQLQEASQRPRVSRTAWVVASDRDAQDLAALSGDCSGAQISSLQTAWGGQRTSWKVTSPADCVLVVATNFTELFAAERSDTGESLRAFPVQGALTGLVIPRGEYPVQLEAVPSAPFFPWGMKLLGGALFLVASLVFSLRERRSRSLAWSSAPPALFRL